MLIMVPSRARSMASVFPHSAQAQGSGHIEEKEKRTGNNYGLGAHRSCKSSDEDEVVLEAFPEARKSSVVRIST
jgi:hypothetical protein